MQQLRLASFVLALSALLGSTALAQTSRGTVTGVVTDATKAAVPGATVEINQKDTNITRTTTTNDQGLYRFDAVDPGMYDVTVKQQGFKTYTSRAVPVSAAQVVAVDAALEVGDNVSVVEVTADSVALQTEAPVRGGTITSQQASRLPVFSRNPNMLAVTIPGVTENRSDLPGIGTFSVNGSRGRSNNFLLDGTENNDISIAGQAFQVKNPEAVQEVSVQTANYDAEFGRAGGAVINTITKSGTNQFHGTLSWVADFTNDDAITSTLSSDPSIQKRGKLPPGYDQYYGGTIGGPIVRNKTFFYTMWQEQRQHASQSTTFNTLSAAGQQDLRRIFPAGSNPRADLYLDITKSVPATGQFSSIDLGDGRGAVQWGTAVYNFPLSVAGRQSLTKVDHTFSNNDQLAIRYGFDQTVNPTAGINFPGFFSSQVQRYNNVLLTETHVFSPTLTNEFRLPYNRITYEFPNDASDPRGGTLPQYAFQTLTGLGVSANFPQGRVANNYGLQDTMSWVNGKHTLRFGFDLNNQRSRQIAPAYGRGYISYATSSFGGNTYHSFANFLDDFGGAGGVQRDFGSATYYPSLFRQAYFFTDRWQIRDNLTLTLGVRYEDFGTPANSLPSPAFAGLFNVNIDPATRTFTAPVTNLGNKTNHDLNNWAPSIGLTFSPRAQNGLLGRIFGDKKTVIRTGYNIGYDSFFNNIASNAATSVPNMVATSLPSLVTADNPRGLPGLSALIPTTPRAVLPIDAQTVTIKDLRNPYYQKWSFGLQREMPWRLVLDGSYVGTSGTRLFYNEDMNPTVVNPALRVLPAGYSSVAQLQAVTPYALQSRLDPLQGSRTIRSNGGHSSYHSAQFNLNKRFSNDLQFNIAYTWSKLLDNGSEIFTYNNTSSLAAIPTYFGGNYLEKGVSLYDRPYRFVMSYYYALPFFRSQQGIAGKALGGWAVSGITTLESGVPLNVSNGADSLGLGGAVRPDFNPNGKPGTRAQINASSPTGYMNPDVWDAAANRYVSQPIDPKDARYIQVPTCALPYTNCRVGTGARNSERTPGIRNTSLNVVKAIALTERFRLEFRGEMFNAFNHPQYGYASPSPFHPGGGTPASSVATSAAGRFLNYTVLDGGGRVVRYYLTLRF
jgi:hypothetical protein